MKKYALASLCMLSFFAYCSTPVKSFSDLRGTKSYRATFNELLQNAKPVVIKFWMPGCTPCSLTEKPFAEFAQQHFQKALFVTLNIKEYDIHKLYDIKTVPTFALFYKGVLITKCKRSEFVAVLQSALQKIS